ncbi:hypothetical protein [Microbacterium galbinum]|uniref:Uncharacterized protein n=1 Tax=Microbacterium galbinum TaxID=2851646 RepID=A0ABY4IL44_9MICO|nr:hypothetical protein [Microbacterium galbinum]UPL13000.1 hypothetical protein KV396_00180 [Microbacterium galbinum]
MVNDNPQIQVQTVWQINPMNVPAPINQILLQEGPTTKNGKSGEYFLSLGHVTPPAFVPEPDGTLPPEAVNGLVLPIAAVGTFSLTFERLVEFRELIDAFVDQAKQQP